MLSGQVLEFLERYPGAFTAQELWEYIPRNGRRILPCHVRQALEQRLFPMGLVAADKDVIRARVKGRVKASPGTRWCALAQAPPGFLVHDPAEGICQCDTWGGDKDEGEDGVRNDELGKG